MERIPLAQVIDRLQKTYGKLAPPPVTDPWELILWENIAYLADDNRRLEAFRALQDGIGTEPGQILSAPDEVLLEVTRHGILAEQFSAKLRRCATFVLEEFDGDLREVVQWPLSRAKKALKKFPGIGVPGAEKILLFSRSHRFLAPDSSGLRVLVRFGFGEQKKSYSTTYSLVQGAIRQELPDDFAWLIKAHQLLRRHGQELCWRTNPACGQCPLASECPSTHSG